MSEDDHAALYNLSSERVASKLEKKKKKKSLPAFTFQKSPTRSVYLWSNSQLPNTPSSQYIIYN